MTVFLVSSVITAAAYSSPQKEASMLSGMFYRPAFPKFDLKVWSSQHWPKISWSLLTSFTEGKTTLGYLNIINLAKSK